MDFEGEIILWETATGNRYNPTLSLGCRGRSTSLWIEDMHLACGLLDGSIAACKILGGDAQSPVTARLRDITSRHGIRHKCDI